jgi:hypothetical protein
MDREQRGGRQQETLRTQRWASAAAKESGFYSPPPLHASAFPQRPAPATLPSMRKPRLTRLCLTAALTLPAITSIAVAQSRTQSRPQGNLSPAALAKLGTLESLNTLPDPRRQLLDGRSPRHRRPQQRRLVPPPRRSPPHPPRLRHLRLPHLLSVPCRRQRPRPPDHLLQRPPRRPRRRPRTHHPLRVRPPWRQGPHSRQAPPHRRRQALPHRHPPHRAQSRGHHPPPQP